MYDHGCVYISFIGGSIELEILLHTSICNVRARARVCNRTHIYFISFYIPTMIFVQESCQVHHRQYNAGYWCLVYNNVCAVDGIIKFIYIYCGAAEWKCWGASVCAQKQRCFVRTSKITRSLCFPIKNPHLNSINKRYKAFCCCFRGGIYWRDVCNCIRFAVQTAL